MKLSNFLVALAAAFVISANSFATDPDDVVSDGPAATGNSLHSDQSNFATLATEYGQEQFEANQAWQAGGDTPRYRKATKRMSSLRARMGALQARVRKVENRVRAHGTIIRDHQYAIYGQHGILERLDKLEHPQLAAPATPPLSQSQNGTATPAPPNSGAQGGSAVPQAPDAGTQTENTAPPQGSANAPQGQVESPAPQDQQGTTPPQGQAPSTSGANQPTDLITRDQMEAELKGYVSLGEAKTLKSELSKETDAKIGKLRQDTVSPKSLSLVNDRVKDLESKMKGVANTVDPIAGMMNILKWVLIILVVGFLIRCGYRWRTLGFKRILR